MLDPNARVELLQMKGHWFLWIGDYLWMWDRPVERESQKKIASKCYGDVLVAGYGLGVVQRYLLRNSIVKSVRTIELIDGVVTANLDTFGRIYGDIVVGDFFDMKEGDKFDCVVGDIWEDIVEESLDKYVKFKEKASRLLAPGGSIIAWGQEFFEYLLAKKSEQGGAR